MARQIVIIDGLIPTAWLCIQATASGSIKQNFFYRFRIKALGYVDNMQSSGAALGKLGPLRLMHHIHINTLVYLPEEDHEYAVFNIIWER